MRPYHGLIPQNLLKTTRLGIEEKYVCLEILKFSGHLNQNHVPTVTFTGKTTQEAKRMGKDPFENLVLFKETKQLPTEISFWFASS